MLGVLPSKASVGHGFTQFRLSPSGGVCAYDVKVGLSDGRDKMAEGLVGLHTRTELHWGERGRLLGTDLGRNN